MTVSRITIVFMLALSSILKICAQVSVDNLAPHSNATLDLDNKDSDEEVLMLPKANLDSLKERVFTTSTTADTSEAGLFFYDPKGKSLNYYDGTVWHKLNVITNQKIELSSGVLDADKSQNSIVGDLEITESIKLVKDNDLEAGKDFIAVNNNSGEVNWKDISTFPAVKSITDTIANRDKIFVASRNLVETSVNLFEDISFDVGVIRSLYNEKAWVNDGSTLPPCVSLSTNAYGRELNSISIETLRNNNCLYGSGFERIDLPSDGKRRIMQVNARSKWKHPDGSGAAFDWTVVSSSAFFSTYYIPSVASSSVKLLGSDSFVMPLGEDVTFNLNSSGSFIHEGNGGYIEPTFSVSTSNLVLGFFIEEVSVNVVGLPTSTFIQD